MTNRHEHPPSSRRTDSGAVMVLALVFLVVASLSVLALTNFGITAEATTSTLRGERTVETNTQGTATLLAQYMRNNYNFPGSSDSTALYTSHAATSCTPTGALGSLQVACEGYQTGQTRNVYMQVCSGTAFTASNCAAASGGEQIALSIEISYTDLPVGEPLTDDTCSAAGSLSSCGVSMAIDYWDVHVADT
jgi:hypothetical protein